LRKVYELQKGMQILIDDDEIIEFDEIRGDKAIFYNSWGIEIQYPDYLDIDEIGILLTGDMRIPEDRLTASLF